MASKLGIAGIPNSGKSYSRRTIPDGENVFLLIPSNKATHIKDSKGNPLKPFDLKTTNFASKEAYMEKVGVKNEHQLISYINAKIKPGTLKPDNLKGNVQIVSDLNDLVIWMKFVSDHLPWIHTAIIPDFTHFISKVISTDEFINRKAGGEAYQRFWELAAKALKTFVIAIDNYRPNLMVVTEYHAEFDEALGGYDIFTPAGKMLKEKFLVPSYYDILLFTDMKTENEGEENENIDYRFVTRPTRKYPYARTMNLFDDTFIPNDLQLVLTTVREYLGIPWVAPKEEKPAKVNATATK